MADSTEAAESTTAGFCAELLSPSELFAARSRCHKIPVRGQKDFLPNSSHKQKERLERSLEEHWSLISEERVERLGSLVKAEWIPSDNVVELKAPAGKFWQTMGFSDQGKQFLLPEEALYLLECGTVQVFYRDLPLSVQEGYELLLGKDTVNLQQYQVFSHLKRLGYIVNRFDPSCVPSLYERQLNLQPQRDKPGRHQLKRKRSPSPNPNPSPSFWLKEEQEVGPGLQEEAWKGGQGVNESRPNEELKSIVQPGQQEGGMSGEHTAEMPIGEEPSPSAWRRSWWPGRPLQGTARNRRHSSQQPGPKWDFDQIAFPDLGSSRPLTSLAAPHTNLLPPGILVRACDITPWLRKVNLKEERLSRREQERERKRQYRRSVNADQEVRRCRSWAEYEDLLKRRSQRSRRDRPAHLWKEAVTPLVAPGQATSTGELLEKISVVKPSRLLDGVSQLVDPLGQWKISFDIYQADTVAEFKKRNPGKPYSRMCVCSFEGPVPDLRTLKQLAYQSGDIPVTFAVVDSGDISFYCFKDFQLPTDVCH
ncbi:SEN54 endonuclease, partial [Amia calva]|nr:SEN54 endonuclease [Amia calva]